MKGLCYNTQGVEYTALVAKEMGFDAEKYDGETMIRLRANGGDISALSGCRRLYVYSLRLSAL